MRFSIFILLCLITTNLVAQTTTIDSLQKAIQKHKKAKKEVNRSRFVSSSPANALHIEPP